MHKQWELHLGEPKRKRGVPLPLPVPNVFELRRSFFTEKPEKMDLTFLTSSLDAKNEESVEATEKHRDEKRKFAEESNEEELKSSKRRCRTTLHWRLAPEPMRHFYLKHLMESKKMTLVLDLDHTLINSTDFTDLSMDELYLLDNISARKDEGLLQDVEFEDKYMLVKLRPYVRQFLREASSMFDMYVYTMGTRRYATEIVKLLDPENKFFAYKVITRSDCTEKGRKALDVVLGCKTSTIILDDLRSVWKEEDRENLIQMPRYNFFSSSCRGGRSLAEQNADENEADGVLRTLLCALKRAHENFFKMVEEKGDFNVPFSVHVLDIILHVLDLY